ncbi:probable solanesyl-diphosphate synthase 3, chloroplastic isoform X1 [Selaginella moellendorffii]|nr:probable solanesyl-diphosphate synthase 3, chloroplastic isoform X1 [Selaginella moellendorffii]|eukprot:XP_024515023.1 probable solanesyl-diphosphate synthase 3, chloroplastic isoform X1 [Selaginella moellendorffii]
MAHVFLARIKPLNIFCEVEQWRHIALSREEIRRIRELRATQSGRLCHSIHSRCGAMTSTAFCARGSDAGLGYQQRRAIDRRRSAKCWSRRRVVAEGATISFTAASGSPASLSVNTSSPIPAGDATNSKFLNGVASYVQRRERREKLSLNEIIEPVSSDLDALNQNLQSIVGVQNPLLMSAAEQIFGAGGKRMRPAIVFLVSRATMQLARLNTIHLQHRRLAEITEMIHTASLIHDDVLDESDVRRGKETVHQLYGTRIAVLAGDFMFAQSSWYLANLDNLEVIKLISQVIKDFASGEIQQASSLFDSEITLDNYLDKSYYKTASLIAASTRSAAIFSGADPSVCDKMFDYGKYLGLAFQIVDDILDFTQSTAQLGKPAGSDLAKGNLTAPALFALDKEPELRKLIDSEFTDEGSLESAVQLVKRGGGIDRAMELAKQKAELAIQALECLPVGAARSSLEKMVEYVLERVF